MVSAVPLSAVSAVPLSASSAAPLPPDQQSAPSLCLRSAVTGQRSSPIGQPPSVGRSVGGSGPSGPPRSTTAVINPSRHDRRCQLPARAAHRCARMRPVGFCRSPVDSRQDASIGDQRCSDGRWTVDGRWKVDGGREVEGGRKVDGGRKMDGRETDNGGRTANHDGQTTVN